MVSSVYWEWELLLCAAKLGVKLAFIYDGIRILRLFLSHRSIVVSVEDMIFWMYSGIVIFQFQLENSNGVLRGFSVLGMFMGMYVYNIIFGERVILLAEKASGLMKRLLTRWKKMINMNLSRHREGFQKNRSKHGRKKKKSERQD